VKAKNAEKAEQIESTFPSLWVPLSRLDASLVKKFESQYQKTFQEFEFVEPKKRKRDEDDNEEEGDEEEQEDEEENDEKKGAKKYQRKANQKEKKKGEKLRSHLKQEVPRNQHSKLLLRRKNKPQRN